MRSILSLRIDDTDNIGIITLDDGNVLRVSLYDLYDMEERPCEGEISDSVYDELADLDLLYKCKKKALSLLSYSEQTRYLLGRKLATYGFSRATVARTLDFLCEKDYLDDERYAKYYAQLLIETRKYGMLRVNTELYKKGIARDIIAEVTDGFFEPDEDGLNIFERNLDELIAAKAMRTDISDDAEKRRLTAALGRLGYTYEQIRDSFRRFEQNDG